MKYAFVEVAGSSSVGRSSSLDQVFRVFGKLQQQYCKLISLWFDQPAAAAIQDQICLAPLAAGDRSAPCMGGFQVNDPEAFAAGPAIRVDAIGAWH